MHRVLCEPGALDAGAHHQQHPLLLDWWCRSQAWHNCYLSFLCFPFSFPFPLQNKKEEVFPSEAGTEVGAGRPPRCLPQLLLRQGRHTEGRGKLWNPVFPCVPAQQRWGVLFSPGRSTHPLHLQTGSQRPISQLCPGHKVLWGGHSHGNSCTLRQRGLVAGRLQKWACGEELNQAW